MGRFSFRAGANAENPDITITLPDRRDQIRRLVVDDTGHVTETFVHIALNDEPEDEG